MLLKFKLLSLMLLFPLLTQAAMNDYAEIESACRKEHVEVNNTVVMGGADLASNAAKKDMNILYRKIYRLIEARDLPDIASRFQLAQKSWLAFRESWCDMQGFMIGSPMYSLCRMEMNISRVNALNQFLQKIEE